MTAIPAGAVPHCAYNGIMLKRWALLVAVTTLAIWFRHAPVSRLSTILWYRVCGPILNWRDLDFISSTRAGVKFNCGLSDTLKAHIIYFGVWEPHITAFIKSRLTPEDVFVDVGANIGYYALTMSDCCRSVVAIEASPIIFQELERNITLNAITNVRTANIAVSDSVGETLIYEGHSQNRGATTVVPSRAEQLNLKAGEVVKTATLFDVLDLEELEQARVIKIDVEGAECPILKSILERVNSLRRDAEIIVEVLPAAWPSYGETIQSILDQFGAAGFSAYWLHNEYAPGDYLYRVPTRRPTRIRRAPTELTDLVISRAKVPEL